ncbi:MAG TPA: DnaJ C-terminal domain-containing protein [Burkholderiales bacterium]|jgi:curved DNA-binding protein
MKYKDYYEILGVPRDADEAAVKQAYRKLARKYHPDVSKAKDAEERFKEIAEAYSTLKDAEKRAAYDNLGRHQAGADFSPPPDWQGFAGTSGMDQGGGMHFEDFADLSELFEQMGLGGRRGARHGGAGARANFAMPGADYEAVARITLEDAARGVELSINLPDADGVPRPVTVRVPRGAAGGERLRVRGKGGPGIGGGPAGDLYLQIELAPHALYRVEGRDLYVDLPLTPSEAVLGAPVELPTLDGKVQLKVQPGASSGKKLRLAGKGLPGAGAGRAGDLYAVVQIVVPASLGEREKALYQELAQASHEDPRAHFAH